MNKREAKLVDALYVSWIKRADLYKQLAFNFQVDCEDTPTSEGYHVLAATTACHAKELMAFIEDTSRLEADNAS